MPTRYFTKAEIWDHDPVLIDVRGWRHGTIDTYVFECDGLFWRFTTEHHHSEGFQMDDPTETTQVIKIQVVAEKWVEV